MQIATPPAIELKTRGPAVMSKVRRNKYRLYACILSLRR